MELSDAVRIAIAVAIFRYIQHILGSVKRKQAERMRKNAKNLGFTNFDLPPEKQ